MMRSFYDFLVLCPGINELAEELESGVLALVEDHGIYTRSPGEKVMRHSKLGSGDLCDIPG
ncbi:hypothetical protein A6X20_02745 [Bradyrhizobium elkanii]|nr:hypothetical protein A6X20_02745 [Bradyrhizobium elkanii]ODM84120.1 hypothetical protein A6452_15145 [Bradyrhizobium elkanii]